MIMQDTIGVDVSKYHRDACDAGPQDHRRFSNDAAGLSALCRWVRERGDVLVVIEGEADQASIQWIDAPSNGACHRDLERKLSRQNLPFAKVNPRQARRFAEAVDQVAKTDRVPSSDIASGNALPVGGCRDSGPNGDGAGPRAERYSCLHTCGPDVSNAAW